MKQITSLFLKLPQILGLGLLCLITDSVQAQTIKYKYDALGRILVVEDSVNGNRSYEYDKAGNRIKVKGPDFVRPSVPSGLKILAVTGSSTIVSWIAATDNVGVSSYEYNLNGGAWVLLNNSTSVSLTGLSPSTSYTFTLRAKDEANNVGDTISISLKTSLNAPTGLKC